MQVPLEITFRHMDPSEAMENHVRESARKLDRFYEHIMSCRVVVEADHRHHHKGNLYHVRVDITVPDGELVASREPHRHHSHEDAYVAIRDAFSAAVRQLEDYSRKRQQHVKRHQVPPHGWVSELHPEGDYGRIATADGRDVYFHRNSVLGEGFDALEVGSEVRADIEEGDEGLQASTVRLIGKHHLAG